MALGTILTIASLTYSAYRYFTQPKPKTGSPTYSHTGWDITAQRDRLLPIVYGQNLVSGNLIYREPTLSATMDIAVGVCEGEIQDIESLTIDDKQIPEYPGSWKGCSWKGYNGTTSQTADARFENIVTQTTLHEGAYVDESNPTVGYINDDDGYLQFGKSVANEELYSFCKFNVTAWNIATSTDILEAKLKFYVYSALEDVSTSPAEGDQAGTLYQITDDSWKEYNDTVTWNTKPATGSSISSPTFTAGEWVEVDVTTYVRARWSADKIASFMFGGAAQDTLIKIGSRMSAGHKPTLEVTLSLADFAAFRRTAYAAITLADNDQLRGTASEFKFLVKGKKIKNWNGSAYVTTYNNCPAWVILDLMTSTQYGAGISETLVNLESFKTVATYCDAVIETTDGNYEKRFQCDIVFDTMNTSAGEAINDILASIGGFYYYVDGQINLGVDKAGSSAHTFTEDNIVAESFSFSVVDKTSTPNEYNIGYTDETNSFAKSYVSVKDEDAQDDQGRIVETVDLYCINRKSQAGRVAYYYLNKSKLSEYRCAFRVSINNADVAPGDICAVTHTVPGWTAKEFIIMEIGEADNDEFDLLCEEYDSSVYDDTGVATCDPEGTDLPNPRTEPDDVSGLTLAEAYKYGDDGTYIPQIKVTWTDPDYIFPLRYHVYWKLQSDSDYIHAGGFEADPVYIDVAAAATYDVYVQTENKLSYFKSDSATAPSDDIAISGDIVGPDNVTFVDASCKYDSDIELVWNPVTNADLDFYEIRLADSDWGTNDANLVVQTRSTSFIKKTRSNSDAAYTFYVKGRDRTGNYSTNADSQVVTKAATSMPALTTTFTGKDCVVDWVHNIDEKDFSKYTIKVYSDAGRTALIRTEYTAGPPFIYTYEKNNSDNSGTPIRTLYFTLEYADYLGQTGSANTDGTNAVPTAPANFSATSATRSIVICWDEVDLPDILGYNVYVKTSSPANTKVAFVQADHYVYTEATVGQEYHVAVAAVDWFGEGTKASEDTGTPVAGDMADLDCDEPFTIDIVFSTDSKAEWTSGSVKYKGASHSVTASDTTDKYIYWQQASPTVFQTSATVPTLGADDWIMATYDSTGDVVYSASKNKIINGMSVIDLDADTITTGTLTGRTVQTAESGQRVVISGANNRLSFYDDADSEVIFFDGDSGYGSLPGMGIVDGAIHLTYNTDSTTSIRGGVVWATQEDEPLANNPAYFKVIDYGGDFSSQAIHGFNDCAIASSSGYNRIGVQGQAEIDNASNNNAAMAVYGISDITDGTGGSYGGYFESDTNSSGESYGAYCYGDSSGTSNSYGVYAEAVNTGSGTAWAGYFGDGDVQIENDLFVDGDIDIDGDFTVGANNIATLGSDLVTNGTFDTDTDWTRGTAWTISGNKANCDTPTAVSYLDQYLTLNRNRTYQVVFTLSNRTAGSVQPYVGATESGTARSADGTYTEFITPSTKSYYLRFKASADFIGSIDDVTLKEVISGNAVVYNSLAVGVESTSYDFEVGGRTTETATQIWLGARSSGDPNVSSGEEVSRTEILFPGWRDSVPDQVGGKIAAINTRREYSGNYAWDDTGIGIYTKTGSTAGPDNSVLALYCHPDQDVECSEELAVKTGKKVIMTGKDGTTYMIYNSSNSHIEFYIGGTLEGYIDSSGFNNA